MDDKDKLFVDELLAASLRSYGDSEPRAGLEGRVLAGVRARQLAGRRRMVWGWALGIAATVAIVTLLVVSLPHRAPAPLPGVIRSVPGTPMPEVAKAAPPVQPSAPSRDRRPSRMPLVDRRPQQFPTPRPLSEQEKLLVAYVEALKHSKVPSPLSTDENLERDVVIPPISIAAIKIEPIAPPEEVGGK